MKKLLSLSLAVIVVLSCITVAFAADSPEQTCPVIYIPGFSSSDIYDDINNTDTYIGFPGTDDILAVVTEEFIPGLITYAVDKDTDKFVVRVTDRINQMFAYWFNEPTGEPKAGSGIIPEKLTDVSATSELIFAYDWRSDPVKIADELHNYIETVCSLSGCDKVALGCHSLGSAVALAYLTEYGNKRVSAMVFDSPACNGVALIGNILTGKVNLDPQGIAYLLEALLGTSEYKALLKSIIDIMVSAGVFELFTKFADEVIAALAPAVYRETVAPLLGYWPTIWSMVPDYQLDAAKAYIFDEILKDEDLTVLKSRLNYYDSTVRYNREETLKSFNDVGKFAILSRYADMTIPLVGYSHLMGDLIIETQASSLGATTADMGEYFSYEYLSGKDLAYISPDKTVDASTCLFPEQTWFIKDSGHFETGGLTENYYHMFLFAEKELTCDTAEIGRFTYCDKATSTLVEDTTTPEKKETPTFKGSIFNFITALYNLIKNLLHIN